MFFQLVKVSLNFWFKLYSCLFLLCHQTEPKKAIANQVRNPMPSKVIMIVWASCSRNCKISFINFSIFFSFFLVFLNKNNPPSKTA